MRGHTLDTHVVIPVTIINGELQTCPTLEPQLRRPATSRKGVLLAVSAILALVHSAPFTAAFNSSQDEEILKELVEQSHSYHPGLAQCREEDAARGPCLSLVCITSRLQGYERRAVIRKTWLTATPGPGLDFLFVVALPKDSSVAAAGGHWQPLSGAPGDGSSGHALGSAKHLQWEFHRFQDLAVLDRTEDGDMPRHMLRVLQWAAHVNRGGQYMFITKAEDDDVINPFQLRLLLTGLPRHGRVFWGRNIAYRHTHTGCANAKKAGALYALSAALAARFLDVSENAFLEATRHCLEKVACPACGDDVISAYIHTQLPSQEWLEAEACQVYNDPHIAKEPQAPVLRSLTFHSLHQCGPEYSNQTVAVHRLKQDRQQVAAFAGLRPFIEQMQQDCLADWGHAAAASTATMAPGDFNLAQQAASGLSGRYDTSVAAGAAAAAAVSTQMARARSRRVVAGARSSSGSGASETQGRGVFVSTANSGSSRSRRYADEPGEKCWRWRAA